MDSSSTGNFVIGLVLGLVFTIFMGAISCSVASYRDDRSTVRRRQVDPQLSIPIINS
jgi:hypothetical protein